MVSKPLRCRLPEILEYRGVTQARLAEKVGLSKQRISDYVHMRDGRIMSYQVAYFVAKSLNVPMEELYEMRRQPE